MENTSCSDTLRSYYSRLLEKELTVGQTRWVTASVLSFVMTVLPLPCPDAFRLMFIALFAFSLMRCKRSFKTSD